MFQRAGRFTKKHRLSRPAEFQQVFRSSCRTTNHYLLVIAKKNGLDRARLGLAISRKRIKSAVARNRVKRVIRESFRLNQQLLEGLDIVVTTYKSPGKIDKKELAVSLQHHWQRVKECKNS